MNYRLGAFGWLGGDKYLSEYATANIGLLDQAFAAKWVEGYIHLFGGDDKREEIFALVYILLS